MATEDVWQRLDRLIDEVREARLEFDKDDEPEPAALTAPQLRLIKGGK
jgi:hypothetical protein